METSLVLVLYVLVALAAIFALMGKRSLGDSHKPWMYFGTSATCALVALAMWVNIPATHHAKWKLSTPPESTIMATSM